VCTELLNIELVGVADENEDARQRVARLHRVPVFRSVEELLSTAQPDAVIVAVPTSLHHEVALQIIQAGKHVLIEKPIADTVERAQNLVDAARKARVQLAVGHIERFNPALIELKRQLAEGVLGKLHQIHSRRVGPFPAHIKDVGVIIDLATHDLNVMERVSDSRIVRIFAETTQRLHPTREDMVEATVRFDNGAMGTLSANWLTPTKVRELWVGGERGMFLVNYLTQDLTFFENASGPGSAEVLQVMGIAEGRMIRYPIKRIEPLRAEIEHFISGIQDGTPPLIGGEEAMRALVLAHDIITSGEQHQPISS
jgi:predicted dehydrogenase